MAGNTVLGRMLAWRVGRSGTRVVIVTLFVLLFNIIALYILRRMVSVIRGGKEHKHIRRSGKSRRDSSKKRHGGRHENRKIKSSLPNVLMLLGIPGSGKTTWVTQYLERCDSTYVIVNEESVRGKVSVGSDDPSYRMRIQESMIDDIVQSVKGNKNVVVDDSLNVMEEEFRRRVMKEVPSCNLLVKTFPIKALFARTRLLKTQEEVGGDHPCPTEFELEEMEINYNKAEVCIKEEGWKPLIDLSHSHSKDP